MNEELSERYTIGNGRIDTEADARPFLLRESTNSSKQIIEYVNHTYNACLGPSHPQIPQPASIRIPLRDHQRTLVAACVAHETNMLAGITQYDSSGRKYITRGSAGLIGDPVGAGKSLSVLAYIAHMKEMRSTPTATPAASTIKEICYVRNSSTDGFTLHHRTYDTADPNNCKNLILVPYSLIPQWRGYLKTQTDLQPYIIRTQADMSGNGFFEAMKAADLTLVSSTLYADFINRIEETPLWWERFFVDEADSIKITRASTLSKPTVLFKWFISASWTNIILDQTNINSESIERFIHGLEGTGTGSMNPMTTNWIAEYLHNYPDYYTYHNSYRSAPYLGHSIHYSVPNSYINIIQNDAEYYRRSFAMPSVHTHTYICRRSAINNALRGLVDSNVQQLIDADDIGGALDALHLQSRTVGNLIEAVEVRYLKDIHNIQVTITYRESLEYVSERNKEEALASLRRSKERAETQLASFRERIGTLKNESSELCPICYDTPTDVIYTPCCQHIYCAGCILKCLRAKGACPMCRTALGVGHLIRLQKENETPRAEPAEPKKRHKLLEILKQKPKGRFLVFSHYDNPFEDFGDDCSGAHISYRILKGNSLSISKAVDDFEKGKLQVLFLNSRELGVGLNLVSATDVILYHALMPEEEKQVVGRALRMGRTAPLTVHKLQHAGEVPERH